VNTPVSVSNEVQPPVVRVPTGLLKQETPTSSLWVQSLVNQSKMVQSSNVGSEPVQAKPPLEGLPSKAIGSPVYSPFQGIWLQN